MMSFWMPKSMKDLGTVAVFMGGWSSEREISLLSGQAVVDACRLLGIDVVAIDLRSREDLSSMNLDHIDRVFIALHGLDGEGGLVQAWLTAKGIPYTGSAMDASSLCMNKAATKAVCASYGVPCSKGHLIMDMVSPDSLNIDYPLCIKPNSEGSSLGVVRVDCAADWDAGLQEAMKYDHQWLVEPWVVGREFTVGILQGQALPVLEIKVGDGFYDYKHKYTPGGVDYEVPCALDQTLQSRLREMAIRAFHITGCRGWGRADFMMDEQERLWFVEMNTVPGLTVKSLVPKAAKALGLEFEQLIAAILVDTLHQDQCEIKVLAGSVG